MRSTVLDCTFADASSGIVVDEAEINYRGL